ncbi:MAG: sulfotransferase [Pseudomonadota bacterium]
MFPHFLCIGAQKAGTTWLHHNLSQQPGVWLPPVKEIHFLDHMSPSLARRFFGSPSHHALARAHLAEASAALITRRGDFEAFRLALRLAFSRRDWDWYSSLFPDRAGLICGEICPGYARLPRDVIRSVVERNPNIKIIYLLRDPIDRAWSSVAMHFRKRGEQTIDAIDRDNIIKRIRYPKFFAHCKYDENIENWLSAVPPAQMYFGFFERIAAEPWEYLGDILGFLGLAQMPAASAPAERINAGKGEVIDAAIEGELAVILHDEAVRAHDRFGNAFTAKWLAHARAVAQATKSSSPVNGLTAPA